MSRARRRGAGAALACALAALCTAAPARADLAFGPAEDVSVLAAPMAMAQAGASLAILAREPVPLVALVTPSPSSAPAVRTAPLSVGAVPEDMAVGDLDGDGVDEIVVASSGTNAVSVIRDLGPPVDTPAAQVPVAVAVGDLTGDHKADVLVAGSFGLTLLRGDGAGGLGPAAPVVTGQTLFGDDLLLADLDGDGDRDAVYQPLRTDCVFTTGFLLRAFLNDGAGAFPASADAGPCPGTVYRLIRMAAGELSGDGIPDIALAGIASVDPFVPERPLAPQAELLRGRGDGSLPEAAVLGEYGERVPSAGPFPALGVAVADLDGDGRPEVVLPRAALAGGARAALAVLPNRGNGAFGPVLELPLPAETGSIVPMDFDGDGALDLVVGRGSAVGTIGVLRAAPVPAGQGRPFGEQEVGRSSPLQALEVENRGIAPLPVSAVALGGPAAGDFAVVEDACIGRTLRGGERCTIRARFTPTAAGRREAEVVVSAPAPVAPLRLALDGTGVAAPEPPPAPAPAGPPTARTGCAARWSGGRASVTCGVVLSRPAPGVRVSLRLVRAGRTWAAADAARGGRLPLRALRLLTAGRYALVVLVREGAVTRRSRGAVTVKAPPRR